MRSYPAAFLAAVLVLPLAACDDPVEGPIGGVVLTIASIPAPVGTRAHQVERIVVEYHRVEGLVREEADGETRRVVLDSLDRRIEMENSESEILVAQFQVPVGELTQLRFFPSRVLIILRDGSEHDLSIDGPWLPSWRRTGWKIVPSSGSGWVVVEDDLIGVRGLLDFDDRLVAPPPGNARRGWKMKPTLPAEQWVVNPEENEPGIFADRIDVVLVNGSTNEHADALASALNATILHRPRLTTWYRFRLPVSVNYEDAESFLLSRPEVVTVLPAVNFAVHQENEVEPSKPAFEVARITEARALAASEDPRGFIGSHHVKVGVIDSGIGYDQPDFVHNIRINQHVLPQLDVLFPEGIAPYDCDPPEDPSLGLEAGDGLITVHDLDCASTAIRPREIVDGQEYIVWEGVLAAMLEDPRWAPDPPVIDDRTGHENDLIGWNFMADHEDHWALPPQGISNDPRESARHGTQVAGIIGGERTGINQRVSLIPLRAALVGMADQQDAFPLAKEITVPHPSFVEALRYAELRGLHVVNVSLGLTLVEDRADHRCGQFDWPHGDGTVVRRGFGGFKRREFRKAMDAAIEAYETVFDRPSRTLYVFSAVPTAFDTSDDRVIQIPSDILRRVPNVQDNVVVVGATPGGQRRAFSSNYGEGVDIYAPLVWQTIEPDHTSFVWPIGTVGGTSFATAGVSGSVALLLAHEPEYRGDPAGIIQRLLETAREAPEMEWCLDQVEPGLVLDAEALLRGSR